MKIGSIICRNDSTSVGRGAATLAAVLGACAGLDPADGDAVE
jgi:hypothetical protein